MKYELKTEQFCALARDSQWQAWLSVTALDLHSKLKNHLKTSRSCKSNREVMQMIRVELGRRGLNNKLVTFLNKVFPIALRPLTGSNGQQKKKLIEIKPQPKLRFEDLNKHNVFKIYKPHLLSFPHKKIIVNEDRVVLERCARQFMKTKIYTDHVIIEDRAYIEYFESRFRKEAEKVDEYSREIYQYKKSRKT